MEDLLTPTHCISFALQRTARRVASVYAEELRTCGLGRSQFPILEVLAASRNGETTTDLAHQLEMDRTTLTRVLGPLEKGRLVSRQVDPEDARVRRIMITDSGVETLKSARAAWLRAQARTLDQIGVETWRALSDDLKRLRRAVS